MRINHYTAEDYVWVQKYYGPEFHGFAHPEHAKVEAIWAELKKAITEKLNERGISVEEKNFHCWYYKHGGVNLTVRYTIHPREVTQL